MTEIWFLVLVWLNVHGEVTESKTFHYRTEAACQAERAAYERGPTRPPSGVCVKSMRPNLVIEP